MTFGPVLLDRHRRGRHRRDRHRPGETRGRTETRGRAGSLPRSTSAGRRGSVNFLSVPQVPPTPRRSTQAFRCVAFPMVVTSSGRCEEIEKLVRENFGSKKSRARMPRKRPLGRRHTFCISLDFGQIDFFTSSCPRNLHETSVHETSVIRFVLLPTGLSESTLTSSQIYFAGPKYCSSQFSVSLMKSLRGRL